jgi:hypothetical protein
VLFEFGGLRRGRGSWVGRGSSSLAGDLVGRRGGRSWCWEWGGVVGFVELCKVAVEGHDTSGHGSDVSFALPLRCPLDTTELQRHRVSLGGRAAVGAGPNRDSHDGGRIRRVGQAVCVPPVGAAFALEERRAGVLIACVLSA